MELRPTDDTRIRESYRRETAKLLKRRIDLAVALFIAFVGLALYVDVQVHPEHRTPGLWIYAAEILVCLVAMLATRLEVTRRHVGLLTAAMGSALGLLMNAYFVSAVDLAPEIQALGLVCLMTAFAVLIPLGCAAQSLLAAATLAGFFVASRGQISLEQAAYCWVGLVAGATTSVFGATFLDRYRYEAFARAALLEEASARSKREAQISAALVHVGAALHASTGRTHVFETVNRLARELLECDWSSTFALDEEQGGYHLEASAGLDPRVEAELKSVVFPRGSLALFDEFEAGKLVEIRAPEDQGLLPADLMARFETASGLYVPVFRDDRVIGILVNGYRSRRGAFTPVQHAIALGIGNATAVALENARLLHDLEAASLLKSEFVSTMSHELRTPLNVITGYTDMLSDPEMGDLSAGQLDLVQRIHRNATSLLELIESTLHLGRLEAGRDPLRPEWVDVEALFAQLETENEEVASASNVALAFRRTGRATALVEVDRGKVKLILQNLIGNAVKFAMDGRVDVHAHGDREHLLLEVRDTGTGIPPENLARIFEMFQQLDAAAPGVGLGLHIVQRVTERLGGSVSVESELGTGTRFMVSIPVQFATDELARTG